MHKIPFLPISHPTYYHNFGRTEDENGKAVKEIYLLNRGSIGQVPCVRSRDRPATPVAVDGIHLEQQYHFTPETLASMLNRT